MRRALTVLLTLAALVAGLLAAAPSTAQVAAVAADPGPAQERLNRGRYETGTVPTPAPFPTVELSQNGVFHLHAGIVHSQRYGARTRFPGAPVDWSPGPQSASAASGSGDYVVAATALTAGAAVQVRVETVAVAATTAVDRPSPSVPSTDGATTRRLDLAASGDHVFLAVVQGSADGARSAHLLRSPDRGQTWEAPLDLLALTGLDAEGGLPVVSLAAEGSTLAMVVGDADEAGSALVSDDRGATFDAPVDLDALEATPGAVRRPAAVATDGSSVRVAWLRSTSGSAPVLLSALVGASGSPVTVPTAPSTFPDGVGTEVVLAHLGSTYAVQVEGGRLFSLDPDGAWRWPLPFEPTDTEAGCEPSCPTILPAAVYGDRLVHRDHGYFSYWFIDRTPARMTVQQNPGGLLEDWQTVVLEFQDAGGIDSTRSTCHFDGRRREFQQNWPGITCSGPPSVRPGRHEMTATIVDLAGNVTTFRHAWTTVTRSRARWVRKPRPESMPGRSTVQWRVATKLPLQRQWLVVETTERSRTVQQRIPVSPGHGQRRIRLRAGTRICLGVQAVGTGVVQHWPARTCTTVLTDDARGIAGGRRVTGSLFHRGSATELVTGSAATARKITRGKARSWHLRVLTCPTCGELRVVDGERTHRYRLDSPRPRMVSLRWSPRRTHRTIRLHGSGGRVVVDGFWAE
ncbi:hypothetical protein [Nocardioides lianchengensis]|uniref:BNR repeat-like domain-containing protein n=1 Tax=Nocardioides lianchengensis TaxID=1045774 RepID=A0A1G6ZJ95_9ACTN|nr:hypothetical protein [Nocardioides lianchengensis]NYG11357.1 hypothetical protein [Nocardioides lianchengensis]SDE02492.1 hypothetical protein SAMN05421872_113167 [Nocardioides lianchengensis]